MFRWRLIAALLFGIIALLLSSLATMMTYSFPAVAAVVFLLCFLAVMFAVLMAQADGRTFRGRNDASE